MRRLIDDPDIRCVDVDGCDFGMQTSDGVPIRKQWRIATSCPELANELRGRTCSHETGYPHARIEGSLTPLTARYPIGMCKTVIKGLYGDKPYAAAPATLSEQDDAPAAPVEVTEADPCAWRRDKDALLVHIMSDYATLPTRQTPGSAGLDLSLSEEVTVPAKGSALVRTGCAFTFLKGVYGRIAPRSGLAVKHMLDVGAGVIDPDFSGEVRDYEFRIRPGDRIAQLILEKVMIVDAKITVKQPT